ncbi:MAG: helix-turn-helix domain-containing protein [Rubrivivax sp.]
MPASTPHGPASLPAQPFFAQPVQRVGLARERFFGDGQRPTGLVSEPVIQSWSRCLGARRAPGEQVAFDPVSRSRLHAMLDRNRGLLQAASAELQRLEAALGGTGCRVLLTDAEGVIVHTTVAPVAAAPEPVLKRVARVGVNLAEGLAGTNAPAVVVKTGAPVTVLGAEHYFDCIRSLNCAAAPIRDGLGTLAGVLDLTVEGRPFGFDAAALVGVYATAIENRLLQAAAQDHLVLQFQVCATLLDTPLQALVGVDRHGRLAWLNGTAAQLLGGGSPGTAAEAAFGAPLSALLSRSSQAEATPLRLPNGLGVWLRARLLARDGARAALALGAPPAAPTPALADRPTPPHGPAPRTEAAVGAPVQPLVAADTTNRDTAHPTSDSPLGLATLNQHTREVIERALQQHGGNISGAARALGVSRGLLYRRLREWRASPGAAPPHH